MFSSLDVQYLTESRIAQKLVQENWLHRCTWSDALGVAEGDPPLTIFACTTPTEGAPSLRFLQERGLSLSKGWWVAMLRLLFDFVVDT